MTAVQLGRVANPCPTGCGRAVAQGKLMCGPCWHRVPTDLQTRVYRTWRIWQRRFGDEERMAAYIEARDAAVSAAA